MTDKKIENPTQKEYWEIKEEDSKRKRSYKYGRIKAEKVLRKYMELLIDNPNKAKEYLDNKTKLRTDRNTKKFYFWLVQELNWLVVWLAENYDNKWEDWQERMNATIQVILGD